MKITDKNYRMSRPLKVMLAGVLDPQRRGEIKRAMIAAEVAAQRFRNSRGRTSGDRTDAESN